MIWGIRFNTYTRKAFVAESVIMQIKGHSTGEMFDRYNTVDEDDIKGAVAQMGCFWKVFTKSKKKPCRVVTLQGI